jgi:hypothetical protein
VIKFVLREVGNKRPGEFSYSPRAEDYAALGQFVAACSFLELVMHAVLRHLLRLDDKVERALVGEPRSGDLLRLLRFGFKDQAVIPCTDAEWNAIDTLLQRITYVYSVRSIVAHKPCRSDGASMQFHNELTTKKNSPAYKYECTAAQLRNCAMHAMEVALALDRATMLADQTTAQFVKDVRTLLASSRKSDLPIDPESRHLSTKQTPKQKHQPQPSPKSPSKER